MTIKLIVTVSLIISGMLALYFFLPYRVINQNKSDNYYFNFLKTKVHYVPMGNSFEPGNDQMNEVDVKSVSIAGRFYIKDKSHVYFRSTKIKGADAASFEILCNNNAFFAKDKNHIYFESHPFKDLDIGSFQFVGDSCGGQLVKDKNHVYSTYSIQYGTDPDYIIPPLENIKAASYQFVDKFYGKDEQFVYYKGIAITGSDPKTFALLDDYARDNNHVFYQGLLVENLDAATFQLIEGGGYMKDKNGVYFGLDVKDEGGRPAHFSGRKISGADPGSFTMIKGEKVDYARDKSGFYWSGKIQKAAQGQ